MYHPMLDTFIAVADYGSFTKAAEHLFISPTAVMKQMNALDEEGLMDKESIAPLLENKIVMIILSIVLTLLLYFVFTRFLSVILPRGSWISLNL